MTQAQAQMQMQTKASKGSCRLDRRKCPLQCSESSTESIESRAEQRSAVRLFLPRCARPSGSSPTWWMVHPNRGQLRRRRGQRLRCGVQLQRRAPWDLPTAGTDKDKVCCNSLHHSTRAAVALVVLPVDLTPFWLERLGRFAEAQNLSVGTPSHV